MRSEAVCAAGVLSRGASVVAGCRFKARAPWLTGLGVCPGPRAPYFAASLRKDVVAEGLPKLGADDVAVLELAVSPAQAMVLEAAGER